MNTITQIILSLALSAAVAMGFNPTVQANVSQAVQRLETSVTQSANAATQAVSNVGTNVSAQTSTDVTVGSSANAQSSTSVSASSNANGSLGFGSLLNLNLTH